MYYTRIYADAEGNCQFEKIHLSLIDEGIMGAFSLPIKARTVIFQEARANYDWDFHTSPERHFIVLLDGEIEITNTQGVARRFVSGDILLVEYSAGIDHKTRHIIQCIRKTLFLTV